MYKPVLLVRADKNDTDSRALNAKGISSIAEPYLEIKSAKSADDAILLTEKIGGADWLIICSTNCIKYWGKLADETVVIQAIANGVNAGLKIAALGKTTAAAFRSFMGSKFAGEVYTPKKAYSKDLAIELVQKSAGKPLSAVIPQGNLAQKTLEGILQEAGWNIESGVVYETNSVELAPLSSTQNLESIVSCVLLRSPSAARAFARFHPNTQLPVICAGETTAQEARAEGLNVKAVASAPDAEEVALVTHHFLSQIPSEV